MNFMPKTIAEVIKELQALTNTQDAMRYLVKEMKADSETWSNIRYVTGYLGNEERNRILGLFNGLD